MILEILKTYIDLWKLNNNGFVEQYSTNLALYPLRVMVIDDDDDDDSTNN